MSQKDQLDRLESKVDKTIDAVAEIGINLAKMEVHVEKNTSDLEEHIEGVKQTRVRLDRLEKHDQWLRGAFWMLAGIAGVLYSMAKILK